MGRTFVNATVIGQRATRDYSFMIDTGSTYMGLPIEEIEELGLTMIPDGKIEVLTPTGIIEQDSYLTLGSIQGRGFGATVVPSPIPVIGYEMLENLRFKVNPVTRRLERVPLDEPHPPYQLLKSRTIFREA